LTDLNENNARINFYKGISCFIVMEVLELRCRRCKEIKPLSEYDRGFFNKKGYDVYCHDCRTELDKIAASLTEKRCRQCNRTKNISEFGKNSSTLDGYNKECLDCREQNLIRRRERKYKGIWNGEMGTCTYCGMSRPTYDLVSYGSKSRYCRICINRLVRQKVLKFEQVREEQGWVIKKRCKGCGNLYPSDRFSLDRTKKDGFSDLCDDCNDERNTRYFRSLEEKLRTKVLKTNYKKECSICHVLKPVASFTRDKTSLDGLSSKCTTCAGVVNEEYVQVWSRNRNEKGEMVKQLQCNDCGRTLPISNFTRTKNRKKGYLYICKDCLHERQKEIFKRWDQERKKAQFEFTLYAPTEKACKMCGRVLPLSEFYFRQASKDGYTHYCKQCDNIINKRWKKKARKRGFPDELIPDEKKCSHCKRVLPQVMFYRDPTSTTGLDCRCIECRKAYDKEYHMRPEVKERKTAYRKRPDVKEKKRISSSLYYQKPEVKERVRAYKREYKKRPYVKDRINAYARRRNKRPEIKQKKKEYDSRPEVKARKKISTHRWQMRKKAERERQKRQS